MRSARRSVRSARNARPPFNNSVSSAAAGLGHARTTRRPPMMTSLSIELVRYRSHSRSHCRSLDEAVEPLYPGYPECRVLIYNVAKKQNVGTIVRTAVAFAATQIIVVGNVRTRAIARACDREWNRNASRMLLTIAHLSSRCLCAVPPQRKLNTLGNQATNRFISWKHFEKWSDCLSWVRSSGFKLVGVEIGERAKDVATRPFSDKTIFVLGNEGQGLSQETMDACDELVYIPQYGRGTASLNVATATSIVLHHFAEYAKYPSHAPISGFKFEVDVSKARVDQGLKLKMMEDAAAASSNAAAADGEGGEDGGDDGGD
jgi:tRNA(Leu) C34 or U34 (ribose-2'-O)-methylase TrmL